MVCGRLAGVLRPPARSGGRWGCLPLRLPPSRKQSPYPVDICATLYLMKRPIRFWLIDLPALAFDWWWRIYTFVLAAIATVCMSRCRLMTVAMPTRISG